MVAVAPVIADDSEKLVPMHLFVDGELVWCNPPGPALSILERHTLHDTLSDCAVVEPPTVASDGIE